MRMAHRKTDIRAFVVEYRQFFAFLILLGVFRSAIADWNPVPTGSMKPTIVEGDVIWVNKIAYDLKLPFTQISLTRVGKPTRGDIVVFKSARAAKRLVKRLIGLPGDSVMLVDNRLVINGQSASYHQATEDSTWFDTTESLRGLNHAVRLNKYAASAASSFGPIEIPDGYYLMLGDNRDNSADSRVYGLVPRKELVGRASHVLVSFNPNHYYFLRMGRMITPLI